MRRLVSPRRLCGQTAPSRMGPDSTLAQQNSRETNCQRYSARSSAPRPPTAGVRGPGARTRTGLRSTRPAKTRIRPPIRQVPKISAAHVAQLCVHALDSRAARLLCRRCRARADDPERVMAHDRVDLIDHIRSSRATELRRAAAPVDDLEDGAHRRHRESVCLDCGGAGAVRCDGALRHPFSQSDGSEPWTPCCSGGAYRRLTCTRCSHARWLRPLAAEVPSQRGGRQPSAERTRSPLVARPRSAARPGIPRAWRRCARPLSAGGDVVPSAVAQHL